MALSADHDEEHGDALFARGEIDGVRAVWDPVPGQFTAALMFRVGRADETLARSGITHLCEHLAFSGVKDPRFQANGFVDTNRTVFVASGDPGGVASFLQHIAFTLGALPTERLEEEKRILQVEAQRRGTGMPTALLANRFGARGYGLPHFEEFGLYDLTGDDLRAWSAERFTADNAVLWCSSAPPPGLRIPLPHGATIPPPEPGASIARLPGYYRGRAGAIGFSLMAPRAVALPIALGVLTRRISDGLRAARAISYGSASDYQRLTATDAYLYVGADLTADGGDQAQRFVNETIAELADKEPRPDEIDEIRSMIHAQDDTRDAALGRLDAAATDILFDAPVLETHTWWAQLDALTPADVHQAIAPHLYTLLYQVPGDSSVTPPRTTAVPTSSDPAASVAADKTYAPRTQTRQGVGAVSLTVGADGVTYRNPSGVWTVRRSECAALLGWDDGTRVMVGNDGISIRVRPVLWQQGDDAARALDRMVDPTRRVKAGHRWGRPATMPSGAARIAKHPTSIGIATLIVGLVWCGNVAAAIATGLSNNVTSIAVLTVLLGALGRAAWLQSRVGGWWCIPVLLDDAPSRLDRLPSERPTIQAYVSGGAFLGWAVLRGLASEMLLTSSAADLERFARRELTAAELYRQWGGLLVTDMLTARGAAFAFDTLRPGGPYAKELLRVAGASDRDHIADDWATFDRVCAVLDRRAARWRFTRGLLRLGRVIVPRTPRA